MGLQLRDRYDRVYIGGYYLQHRPANVANVVVANYTAAKPQFSIEQASAQVIATSWWLKPADCRHGVDEKWR